MKQRIFSPATGSSNCHIQTLTPVLLGKFQKVLYVRQELDLPDGDFVDIDWSEVPTRTSTKPIVIIFHGLEGSSQSHYVKSLAQAVNARAWNVVVMNFRGCSGRLNRKPRLYHSGETGDAAFFINWLKQHYPSAPLYGIGFSLGGNMLLKLAGEQGESLLLEKIAIVSAPVKLNECTSCIEKGVGRMYQRYLFSSLKNKLLSKYNHYDYKSLINLDRNDIVNCKDIRGFDNIFTAPMHGYNDAEDYYECNSAYPYIQHIVKPCLIVHSQDDPIAPANVLPDNSSLPDHIELNVASKGGHVGFMGGSLTKPYYWLTDTILGYFSKY